MHRPSKSSRKEAGKFAELVAAKIENLRPRLLDLGSRNPLIAMSFHARSTSHVRVVDEIPDSIYFGLKGGDRFTFAALPAFTEDNRDELSERFLEAYNLACRRDEQFLDETSKLDPEDVGYGDTVRSLERELKDRLREELGLPKRITRKDESITQHAKNNGIAPSYDLPGPDDANPDGRHEDGRIQTLLLPNDLERKLNGIISKAKIVQQETGIGVLRVAMGLLEWKDPARSDDKLYLSPLIMMPVQITSRRSPEGPIFTVESIGEDAEVNLALKEKFRREFAIELPDYDGGSIEDYLEAISTAKHKKLAWRVRRQMVFGVFPAARMSMYVDLDTAETDFAENKTLEDILVGSETPADGGLADEYDVDDPVNEAKVNFTVKKADASQFSVLVDLANGKNVAVEGPPGTGKSDTIVNAIASAIGAGKKVLFVAEKAAALEVVRTRLEEIRLGEFVLPLLAGKASRSDFMASVNARLGLREPPPRNLPAELERFTRARDGLASYVGILSSDWGETGSTVHRWIGAATASVDTLDKLDRAVLLDHRLPDTDLTMAEAKGLGDRAGKLGELMAEARRSPSFWESARCDDDSPFTIDRILQHARQAADGFDAVAKAQARAAEFKIKGYGSPESHDDLAEVLGRISELIDLDVAAANSAILCLTDPSDVEGFLDLCRQCQNAHAELSEVFRDPHNGELAQSLAELADICASGAVKTLDMAQLGEREQQLKSSLESVQSIARTLEEFVRHYPDAAGWTLTDVGRVKSLLSSTPATTLRLRNATLADGAAVEMLADLSALGAALQTRESDIATKIRLGQASVRDIASIHGVLRNAGRLSFLSGDFRSAKRRYREMSRGSGYSKATAIADLDAAQTFLEDQEKFLERARNSSVFGSSFNGLETKFQIYADLAKFYKTVDETFADVGQRSIRTFLKSADIDILGSVPTIPQMEGNWKIGDVDTLHQRKKGAHATFVDTLTRIGPRLRLFNNPRSIAVHQLAGLQGKVAAFQALRDQLDAEGSLEPVAGTMFSGWQTEVDVVEPFVQASRVIADAGDLSPAIQRACKSGRLRALADLVDEISGLFATANESFEELCQSAAGAFWPSIEGLSASAISSKLAAATTDRSGLSRSLDIGLHLSSLDEAGVLYAVDRMIESGIGTDLLGPALEGLLYRSVAERIYGHYGKDISRYSGTRLEELRRQLKSADDEMRALSLKALRSALISNARPPAGTSRGKVGDKTEMGLLDHLQRNTRIRQSVRDIAQRSAQALLEIKPCWIMSPLAVAQYIPKGTASFDLCIIDEASQMPPEDAIGALYRSSQAMIVGDTKQLPPTNFFRQVLDDQDENDDADPVTEESVLEMANSTFRPKRMLRWHYRSRHSSLIRFSNRIMYDDNLIVFPSPNEEDETRGVSLVSVKGFYKSSLNDIEAHRVVDDVLTHMKAHPDRSLGVVAVNKAQSDYIRELLDYQIARNPTAFRYVEHWAERDAGLNAFFVKNLENVQGDERDVIFISTVYGPPGEGKKTHQRFGPINGRGGQRRLNVLFSRARDRIVTYSSMTPADITAEESSNAGAWMLKRWLEYSAGGPLEAGPGGHQDAFDSPLEAFVADQIRSMGCKVDTQVGVAGYSIDLGIRHPDWPYGYILGVECDGATYHSSRSARDRDRHRQEILENLGWRIHRVWSTDWFANPRDEAARLRAVISERIKELKAELKRRAGRPAPIVIPPAPDVAPKGASQQETAERAVQARLPLEQPQPKPGSVKLETSPAQGASLRSVGVQIGDTVRIRYLDKPDDIFQFRILVAPSAPEKGIVGSNAPLARAVIGCEIDDEFEVLFGSRIRRAVVERLEKSKR